MTNFLQKARKFFTNKLLVLILIFVVLVIPTAFLKQPQGEELAHCLALGIDFKEDKYIIHAEVLTAKKEATPDENIENVNAESDSVESIIESLEKEIGKNVGLENVSVIIFSESVLEDKYENILRLLINKSLPYSAELAKIKTGLVEKMEEINELDAKKSLSEKIRYEGKNGKESISVGRFLTKKQADEDVKIIYIS